MKILCISDEVDPIVYSTSIKKRFGDVDLVVSAGDLPMEYYDFIVSSINKPLLFVYGNHNLSTFPRFGSLGRPFRQLRVDEMREETNWGAHHIGFRTKIESGLLFMGLGGCMRYNSGANQFTERQMFFRILSLLPALLWNRIVHGRWLDVLVTHAPPEGIHDKADPCHRGFRCYRWFLDTFRPSAMIHGHVHLYDLNDVRQSRFAETEVVNAYGHCVITIGEHIDV